jgi:hypothetical protein
LRGLPGRVTYLLIGHTRRLSLTRWLTAQHYASARRGDLLIVEMARGERFGPGGWRPIPPRRGEPLVMLVPPELDDLEW